MTVAEPGKWRTAKGGQVQDSRCVLEVIRTSPPGWLLRVCVVGGGNAGTQQKVTKTTEVIRRSYFPSLPC